MAGLVCTVAGYLLGLPALKLGIATGGLASMAGVPWGAVFIHSIANLANGAPRPRRRPSKACRCLVHVVDAAGRGRGTIHRLRERRS